MMIRKVDESNLEEAIDLVFRLNQDPANNISYFGETREEIEADFSAVQPPEGYGFIALNEEGKTNGFFGIEMDLELGRSWLFGPLIEGADWDTSAEQLYQAILADLPPEITGQEIYFPIQNERLEQFATRHGFVYHTEGAVLLLDIRQQQTREAPGVIEFNPIFTDQLGDLHAELFPKTYHSAGQLIELARQEDKKLLIQANQDQLAGYIFVQLRPASRDMYIDFLGVDRQFRRQGIAQDLVAKAVDWAVKKPYVESVTLTVGGDNEAAIKLYHSLGFNTQSVARAYRKRS